MARLNEKSFPNIKECQYDCISNDKSLSTLNNGLLLS